ncbi:MAG: hypothetical protein P8Z35_26945, partial [Ignavibacteriaceae bacterium]
TGVEKSRVAMVPPVATCMNCHTIARKDRPEIIKLTQYYKEGKALPWKRVHRVPDFVFINKFLCLSSNLNSLFKKRYYHCFNLLTFPTYIL